MSIASEISRLQTSKADVKTQVNIDKDIINGGTAFIASETVDDYDDKIEEMQEAYKKFIPIQTATGTSSVTIDNTSDDKALTSIALDGNTEQFTTTGINLAKVTAGFTQTTNGITVTVNSDRSISVTGTATANATIVVTTGLGYPSGAYTMSCEGLPSDGDKIRIRFRNSNGSYSEGDQNNSAELTYVNNPRTFNNRNVNTVEILVFSGAVVSATLKLQLQTGTTASSYEPYTGGIASPNPSYPQEVKTVTGENTIDIAGKNLINPNSPYGTSLGITTTYNSENQSLSFSGTTTGTWAYLTNKLNVNIPKGEYTFSIDKTVSAHTVIFRMFYNSSQYQDVTIYTNTTSRTMSITNDTISYQIYIGGLSAGVSLNDTLNFQIEKGSTATTYEPYQSQSYSINLGSLELCKIGDYQDYIYNNNGTWYKHSEIGKVVLDGTENISLVTTGTNYTRFNMTLTGVILGNTSTYTLIKSNYYYSKYAIEPGAIFISSTQNIVGIIHNSVITLNDYKTWLSNNNPLIYYPLATPTDTEITDENLISQLEAVKLLSGTQNNFTIDADTLPTLNLNYIGEASPHL